MSPSGPTAHDTPAGDYVPYAALTAIVFSTFAVVSAVVAARRPRNPVGWLIGAGSFLWALAVLANSVYWHIAFGRPDPPAAADYVAWLGNWAFLPAFLLLLGLVPLLFPTGAPPGPGWRKVGWIAAVAGGVAAVGTALAPGPMDSADFGWIDNPFGIGGLGLGTVADVSFALVGAAALAGIASLVVRYRRAHGIERLQLKWVAGAACLLVLFAVGGDVASTWLGSGAGWAGTLLGLLCVASPWRSSLLRYRLYDIDVVINRTLVYGALTAMLAATYLAASFSCSSCWAAPPATLAWRSPPRRSPSPPCSARPGPASSRPSTAASTAASTTPSARSRRSPRVCATRSTSRRSISELRAVVRETLQPSARVAVAAGGGQ